MEEFFQGQRVMTPRGEGKVAYVRMRAPDFSRVAAVSVRINGVSVIFPVEQVKPLPELEEAE